MGNVNLCREPNVEEAPTKLKNQKIEGAGGALDLPSDCKVHVCVVAYDYDGYPEDKKKFSKLSATRDGVRFAKMAKDSGAVVREYYDRSGISWRICFPTKQVILDEWRRVGAELGRNDVFIFYFAGHGLRRLRGGLEGEEEEDGFDEMMVFMEPDGTPSFLLDDEVATVLSEAFSPQAHVLFITDCSHSVTMCDLSRPKMAGRPVVHLAAARDDSSSMPGSQESGAFTSALLDTVEELVEVPLGGENTASVDFSVVDVYNKCFESASPKVEGHDFSFEKTSKYDPDTFRWPLVPPPGWIVNDPLDKKPATGLGGMFACIGTA